MSKPNILIAPLDWGLGHATRVVPIIEYLLEQEVGVILAGAGRSLSFLTHRFPDLQALALPGYHVRYSSTKYQVPAIIKQIPRLLSVIKEEKNLISQWIEEYEIDGIISDNRYGVSNSQVPSVFICHQLAPAIPQVFSFMRKMVYQTHISFLTSFDEIWVPDLEGKKNLSGHLSHLYSLPKKARFIGPLSRFDRSTKLEKTISHSELKKKAPDVLVILSGPEPQRSILETIIFDQAFQINQEIWIVQGKTEEFKIETRENVKLISFLGAEELREALIHSNYIISRSGYSSIMDYFALELEKIILIPTPGQTEQEYLAKVLAQKELAVSFSQKDFSLAHAIQVADNQEDRSLERFETNFKNVLGDFLRKV